MNQIKILDCTLRDGGYVNDWNFGRETISNLMAGLTNANIDIIECGFIVDKPYHSDYTLFSDTEQINEIYNISAKRSMYVGMVDVGEKGIHYEKISPRTDTSFDGIRIAFHQSDCAMAIEYAKDLIKKGYEVFIQPMVTQFYSDETLLELIKQVNELDIYAFYIVDSLGSMQEYDLIRLFYLLDYNLKSDIRLGFHSHNNLQLSFSNSISFIKQATKRELILDSSILGMGRSAGNLCTELITNYINEAIDYKYNQLGLFTLIDNCISPIREKYIWGYLAPFYISARKKCHPNYANYFIAKETLPSADIDKILSMIPQESSHMFNKDLAQDLYINYQDKQIDDKTDLESLSELLANRKVLLIAPGQSIKDEQEKILNYVNDKHPLIVTINFIEPTIQSDFIFIANKRYYADIKTQGSGKYIVTSNIEKEDKIDYYINYSSLLNSTDLIYDNSGLMCIQLMINLGVEKITLAGFDGFKSDIPYRFNKSNKFKQDNPNTDIINANISKTLKIYSEQVEIDSITSSIYF